MFINVCSSDKVERMTETKSVSKGHQLDRPSGYHWHSVKSSKTRYKKKGATVLLRSVSFMMSVSIQKRQFKL